MTIGRIKEGDPVRIDVRGQRFWALAAADGCKGRLAVEPLPGCSAKLTATHVTARQVVGHWRPTRGSVV